MTAALVAPDVWSVDDVALDGPAWGRDPGKGGRGLAMTPGLRDTSSVVPQRRGVLSGDLVFDAGMLVLNMWVIGVDPETGLVPAWSSTELELARNLSRLLSLFHRPSLPLRRARPDGAVRVATGRLAQVLDPDIQDTTPAYAELGVAIRIDDGLWHDEDLVVEQLEVVSGQTARLWAFDGAEAPLDDLEFTLWRAWNPVIADAGGTGTWAAYDAVLPDGQALVVDAAAREIYGAGGLLLDQGLVRRGGWLTLAPGSPPAVTVGHTGPEPAVLQVSGRRGFLTA